MHHEAHMLHIDAAGAIITHASKYNPIYLPNITFKESLYVIIANHNTWDICISFLVR